MTPERKEALLDEAAQRAREILAEQLDAVGERPLTVDEIEALVEEASREAARWLEGRLITEQTPPATNPAPCTECGQPARYQQTLHTQLQTIHGEQPVVARYYYCAPCGHGFCPADVVLGLERGRKATRRRRAWLARLAVQEESFAAVPPLLLELRGLVTSESTVERTTVEVGRALAAAPAPAAPAGPEPSPSRLCLAMDGTMCPLRDEWRRYGSLGKLVCRYGEAKVGMAFTTRQQEGLDTGIVTRGCLGALEDITVFTPRMVALARQWGAPGAQELVVLGDCAAWIWNLARRYFPQAAQIVDLWHVLERLWTVAEAKFGSRTRAAAKAWLAQMRSHLEQDLVGTVIAELERWEPQRKAHQQLREEQLTFFAGHRERVQYKTYLAQGYMVGSGAIESQCKQLVQRRLHEGGMSKIPETFGALAREHRRGGIGDPGLLALDAAYRLTGLRLSALAACPEADSHPGTRGSRAWEGGALWVLRRPRKRGRAWKRTRQEPPGVWGMERKVVSCGACELTPTGYTLYTK